MPRRTVIQFAFLLFAIVCAGCDTAENGGDSAGVSTGISSTPPQGNDADDLRALKQVYIDHLDFHGQGPASWEATLEFAKLSDSYDPEAIERLQAAGCQVTWNAKMTDAAAGGVDNYQIAALPGGMKLMISGAIVE